MAFFGFCIRSSSAIDALSRTSDLCAVSVFRSWVAGAAGRTSLFGLLQAQGMQARSKDATSAPSAKVLCTELLDLFAAVAVGE